MTTTSANEDGARARGGGSTRARGGGSPSPPPRPAWTFLTNHARVLIAVARDPDVRVADIAAGVGITPRAALLILADLEEAGYVRRQRVGRRNHYSVSSHRPFRHPAEASREVDGLLALFAEHGE